MPAWGTMESDVSSLAKEGEAVTSSASEVRIDVRCEAVRKLVIVLARSGMSGRRTEIRLGAPLGPSGALMILVVTESSS